ncbi:preprotein translocase subunit SecE [Spiroplasma endosymbiont of Crioceris asparagi]|uniref:preprotein translocase subunit SecE n=1 Tax=Spiroplasma endosymbiont of Crioceris asparagi TaxID=3066286 RepID=UPI0030D5CFA5
MTKEEKKILKKEIKERKRQEKLAMKQQLLGGYEDKEKNKEKIVDDFKKEKRSKRIIRWASLKETPIKLVKEANKIKWPKRRVLGMKFLTIVIFIFIFAVFFYGVDQALEQLFAISKIV